MERNRTSSCDTVSLYSVRVQVHNLIIDGFRVSSVTAKQAVELPADGRRLLFALRHPPKHRFAGRQDFVRPADLGGVGGVVEGVGGFFGDAEEGFGEGV